MREGATKTRLSLTDTGTTILKKMSEGNPGAIRVCLELMASGVQIDPANLMGGLGHTLMLDTLGIYGSRIWLLYKDVCGEDLTTMIAVIRSWQFGEITDTQLNTAIDNRGQGIDVKKCLDYVKNRLPNFGVSKSAEGEEQCKSQQKQ